MRQNTILSVYGRPKVLLPVVHCINRIQTIRQIDIAFDNGADGVWLINQGGMSAGDVVKEAYSARFRYDRSRHNHFGVNLLGRSIRTIFHDITNKEIPTYQSLHVWMDDVGFTTRCPDNLTAARSLRDHQGSYWNGLLFGGVAFKYREDIPIAETGRVAYEAALAGVDVITTSGPATGSPPSLEKIQRMRGALTYADGSHHNLAIASGMTCDNIVEFLPYVDAFLVATGIEKEFGTFDGELIRRMADTIHSF